VVEARRPLQKSVTILGATGSIGDSTIDLIQRNPEAYRVVALTAHRNAAKLAQQARVLKPAMVALADEAGYRELKDALAGTPKRSVRRLVSTPIG
jgi:1-deoxy-D-xylulose-5-phosphate reductoisomerase